MFNKNKVRGAPGPGKGPGVTAHIPRVRDSSSTTGWRHFLYSVARAALYVGAGIASQKVGIDIPIF